MTKENDNMTSRRSMLKLAGIGVAGAVASSAFNQAWASAGATDLELGHTLTVQAFAKSGVLQGCAPSIVGSDLKITAGTSLHLGQPKVRASDGTVALISSHATLGRCDLGVITSSGSLAIRQGTAAASPEPPAPQSGDVVVALIDVPAASGTVTLKDVRITLPWPRYLDVTDYGADPEGTSDAYQAFQDALDDAAIIKAHVFVPGGEFYFPETASRELVIDGHVNLIGCGRDLTFLKFKSSDTVSSNHYGIRINDGYSLTIAGMSLLGPLNGHDSSSPLNVHAIFVDGSNNDQRVSISDVYIEGFENGVFCSSNGTSNMNEVDLFLNRVEMNDVGIVGFSMFANTNQLKRAYLRDCYLHDTQTSHLVYIHDFLSFHFENCRFDGAPTFEGTGKYAMSIRATSPTGTPEFHNVVNCQFGSNNSAGCYQEDHHISFINCDFHSFTSALFGGATFENCRFFVNDGESPISSSSTGNTYRISNCFFETSTGTSVTTSGAMINLTFGESKVIVADCYFRTENLTNSMIQVGGDDTVARIDNCIFEAGLLTSVESPPESVVRKYTMAIVCTGGRNLVSDCTFRGYYKHNRATIVADTSSHTVDSKPSLEIVDCLFDTIKYGSIVQIFDKNSYSTNYDKQIVGRGNSIKNHSSSHAFFSVYYGSNQYGRWSPRKGLSDSSLTAGTTVVIDPSYDTFPITGSATITTIQWFDSTGTANELYNGTITLLPSGSLTLANTGNINPLNTTVRTANQAISLTYNPDTNTWWEV